MTRKTSGQTVRPRSSRRSQKVLLVLVFAVTGLGVYRWGLTTVDRRQSTRSYTSTARIYYRTGLQAADPAGKPAAPTWPDPKKIEQQITSPANLHRALGRLGPANGPGPDEDPQATPGRGVEPVHRNLRVTAAGTSTPGELGISITYTDQDPDYAARLVNSLAKHYAEDCRGERKKGTYRAYVEAREASDRAERALLQAKARLDAFCEQQFKPWQTTQPEAAIGRNQQQTESIRAKPLEVRVSDPKTPAPATPSKPPYIDNPEWVALNEQLAGLRRYKDELLADRTWLHPVVRDTELRITALERQLAAIPREVPGRPSDRPAPTNHPHVVPAPVHPVNQPSRGDPPAGNPAVMAPGQTASEHAAVARRFQTLREAADRAGQVYQQAAGLERQAWQAHQQEPRIELELVQPIRLPAAPGPAMGLLLAALAAGLAAAAGVWMISAGAAMEPALASVDQAEAVLPVPIVGTIPDTAPAAESKAAPQRRPLIRLALILGGLVLITGCMGMLFQAYGA